MITKRSISKPNSIEEFGEIAISKKKRSFSFSCSRPLSSSQTTTRHTIRPATQDRPPRMGIEPRHRNKPVGWRSGSPKAYPYHSRTSRRDIQAHDLFHTSIHTIRHDCHAIVWHTLSKNMDCILRRKEVIQPHLPVRLPCYDLVPITSLTLDGSIPQGVRPPASGAAHFHDLTGGVYKARERIHRDVADSRLLATPPSRSRVADCDPN